MKVLKLWPFSCGVTFPVHNKVWDFRKFGITFERRSPSDGETPRGMLVVVWLWWVELFFAWRYPV